MRRLALVPAVVSLVGVFVAVMTCTAAWLVVPETRDLFDLQPPAAPTNWILTVPSPQEKDSLISDLEELLEEHRQKRE